MHTLVLLTIASRVIAAQRGNPSAIGCQQQAPYKRMATAGGTPVFAVATALGRAAAAVASRVGVGSFFSLMPDIRGIDNKHVPPPRIDQLQQPSGTLIAQPRQMLAMAFQKPADGAPMPRVAG